MTLNKVNTVTKSCLLCKKFGKTTMKSIKRVVAVEIMNTSENRLKLFKKLKLWVTRKDVIIFYANKCNLSDMDKTYITK